jgi:Fe-S-cluster-containing dehydrogenase component
MMRTEMVSSCPNLAEGTRGFDLAARDFSEDRVGRRRSLVPAAALELIFAVRGASSANAQVTTAAQTQPHWQFLADTNKCVGCGFCVKACKLENDVPYAADASRTWVERHVVTKDGVSHVDSPAAARDGFTTQNIDIGEGKTLQIDPEDIAKSFCAKTLQSVRPPPYVQVCCGATYKALTGVVLVDKDWCIVCGYHRACLWCEVLPSRVPHSGEMHLV